MAAKLIHEDLTKSVIGAFFEVYNEEGFGFLENVYANYMQVELRQRGHVVQREVTIPIDYKGSPVRACRVDMVVDALLIIEVKSTTLLHPTARRQLRNYLCATGITVGLLLHFGPEPKFYREVFTKKDRNRPTSGDPPKKRSVESALSAESANQTGFPMAG